MSAIWKLYVDCIPVKMYSTIAQNKTDLLVFARYLDENHPELTSLSTLKREIIIGYRAWVTEKYKSKTAHKNYRLIVRCLQTLRKDDSPWPGCLPDDLEIPTKALRRVAADGDIAQPYSHNEEAAITTVCKREINRSLVRLAIGREMLDKGADPRRPRGFRQPYGEEWFMPENLIWLADNVVRGAHDHTRSDIQKFYRYVKNSVTIKEAPFGHMTNLLTHLHPQMIDLIPFIILLSLRTGLNGSSILELKRNCLGGVFGDMTFVRYCKGRGRYEEMSRPFSHKGSLSPVGIIKTVLRITEPLRILAPETLKDNLWLTFAPDLKSAVIAPTVSSLVIMVNTREGNRKQGKKIRKRAAGFMELHDIRDGHGKIISFEFDRARKTHGTKEYLRKGNLEHVSKKIFKHHGLNGMQTTVLHYLANEATQHIHDQTIRNLQDAVVAEAKQLKVITITPKTNEDVTILARQLSEPEEKINALFAGEQDVFIAQCRDFYNQPGGQPNTPCSDAWACFGCPNGLWTSRILPRLVKFLWFMEDQRNLLHATDWEHKFSFPHTVITRDILPRFQARTVEWAKAEAQELPFFAPPHLRDV